MYPPFLNNNDEMSIGHELKLDQLDQLSFQFSRLLNHLQWQRRMLQSDAEKRKTATCFIVIVETFVTISHHGLWLHEKKGRRSAVKWHPKPDHQNFVWVTFQPPPQKVIDECVIITIVWKLSFISGLIWTTHFESSGAIAFHDGNKTFYQSRQSVYWHSSKVWCSAVYFYISHWWFKGRPPT